jgi:hypothetical protein
MTKHDRYDIVDRGWLMRKRGVKFGLAEFRHWHLVENNLRTCAV